MCSAGFNDTLQEKDMSEQQDSDSILHVSNTFKLVQMLTQCFHPQSLNAGAAQSTPEISHKQKYFHHALSNLTLFWWVEFIAILSHL